MKTKIFIILILVAFACLPLKGLAYERNFPAGSIIIPMDAHYQPVDDGGQLEAYGLAYYLLGHQDQECLTDAATEADQKKCEHTVAVSWVINDQKTEVEGIDLVIEVTDETRVELGLSAVVEEYDHAGGTTALTYTDGDSVNKVTYKGSLFIIDVQELEEGVEDEIKALINGASWDAVNVHVAQVAFAAPVFRDMRGTPPKIALMNDGEDKTKGNASILEGYLRLAGICSDSYEVVTPNEIAGLEAGDSGTAITPILQANEYDFLWAPHWVGDKNYDGTKGMAHQDVVVKEIQNYLKSGKGVLGECASIETFEHNPNGHFLADKGFGHNGADKNNPNVLYSNVDAAYSQIGDFTEKFKGQGGHLHNWRPFQAGDPYNFKDEEPDVSGGSSKYNPTVKRFTVDDSQTAGTKGVVDDADWDYFVGGYAYGNTDFGYVVYLGGHSYADCKDAKDDKDDKDKDEELNPEVHIHPVDIELDEDISSEAFKLHVKYEWSSTSYTEMVRFTKAADDTLTVTMRSESGHLVIDLSEASVDKKKLLGIKFRNVETSAPITITDIGLFWNGGDKLDKQKPKKLTDEFVDEDHIKNSPNTFEKKPNPASPTNPWTGVEWDAVLLVEPVDFVIEQDVTAAPGGDVVIAETGCTNNSGCSFKNLAGVRYVLNTLFNIKYEAISYEYVRSAPIVAHPWLYQGTFEHPSYYGHFRRFDVEKENPEADWDTADPTVDPTADPPETDPVKIKYANTGNSDGRKVYTADNNAGDWNKINFDAANVAALDTGLDVTPGNADTVEEIRVIERLRGRDWDYEGSPPAFVEQLHNKLGGIMHSSPVIIRSHLKDSRFSLTPRPEVAYVGDLYGMLHAIETATGEEKWAYIPSNLLGKLQNERSDPNADPHFAAVDASPTAKDIFYDHDSDDATPPEWRTILVCAQGFGGNSIFALDVTDPANFEVLWEATDTVAPGGGMGYSFRAALDKVKVPILDYSGKPIPGEYEVKWMVYVATSFAQIAENHGGINVFAFDLQTGTEQWTFSSTYADSVNDIPGAVTTFDIDDDTLADRIYVGDMNGRLWEIALTDDENPDPDKIKWTAGQSVHEAEYPDPDDGSKMLTKPIPLFYAGIGNPISVSPAIINRNGHVLLVFGTGGADWASKDKGYHVYVVDATEAGSLEKIDKQANYDKLGGAIGAKWSLATAAGEKVWSSPTVANGQIWIVTSFGSMESTDPRKDKGGGSKLRLLNLDTGENLLEEPLKLGKVRGSIYVSRKHVYMTTFDGEIIQLGDQDDFTGGTGNRVVLKSWQQR